MKEVLQYLFERLKDRKGAPAVEVKGQYYRVAADGTLGAPVMELQPQWDAPAFSVSTLSGIAELVRSGVDSLPKDKVALHVVSHVQVDIVSLYADSFGRRHIYATAKHLEGCNFTFNSFQLAEDFLISFRRSFLWNDEAVKVANVCSRLESGATVTLSDDGVAQQIEVRSGTTSGARVVLPPEGVELIPWRTFRDAAPVASRFLLRLKTIKDGLPQVALFEIDQLWKLQTAHAVADYLRKHVKDVPVLV